MTTFDLDLTKYQLGWSDEVEYAFTPAKGINEGVVEQISWWKGEPRWMTNKRLRSLQQFERKPMAEWFAVNMPTSTSRTSTTTSRPSGEQVDEWDELPEQMKATYEKLGIPEAERKYLAGVTAQYECLRGDTQVWTTRGMRPIKELGAGRRGVLARPSRRKQIVVAPCRRRRRRPARRRSSRSAPAAASIGASRQPPVPTSCATSAEPVAKRARYRPDWMPVDELRVGDLVAVPTDLPEFGRTAAARLPSRRTRTLGFTNAGPVLVPRATTSATDT